MKIAVCDDSRKDRGTLLEASGSTHCLRGLSDYGIVGAFILYHGDRDVGERIFL